MRALCELDAVEARRLIGSKEIAPTELLESCIERIESINCAVNAIVTSDYKDARKRAKVAEKAVLNGEELGILHGIPVCIKDLELTSGLRTTMGSLLYKDYIPKYDQGSVHNIRSEGGIILGKTNTPEFGAGANTKNRVFGVTKNPFNTQLSCAGSSGGSAVSLACGMVPLATGSDFGGSLRTPASFCGVVGFRPSPGVVPSELEPVSLSPLSVNGPMGRTVADTALLLSAQTGFDIRDPFSNSISFEAMSPLVPADLGSIKIAISSDLGCAPVETEIARTFKEKIKKFSKVFASAENIDPDLGEVHQAFEILRAVNYLAAHGERVKKNRALLGPNVIDNVNRGLSYSIEDVAWAHKEQTKIYRNMLSFFDEVDILICPTASVSPYPHEQLAVEQINGEKMPTYMRWLALSYGLTMTLPSVCSLPVGLDEKGMPFGMQIVGPNGSDHFVLQVAFALESLLSSHSELKRPTPNLDDLKK